MFSFLPMRRSFILLLPSSKSLGCSFQPHEITALVSSPGLIEVLDLDLRASSGFGHGNCTRDLRSGCGPVEKKHGKQVLAGAGHLRFACSGGERRGISGGTSRVLKRTAFMATQCGFGSKCIKKTRNPLLGSKNETVEAVGFGRRSAGAAK